MNLELTIVDATSGTLIKILPKTFSAKKIGDHKIWVENVFDRKFSVRPSVCRSVRPSIRPSVGVSRFTVGIT